MGPPEMDSIPRYGPSLNIIPSNSQYSNSIKNSISKVSIKPSSMK